MLGYGRDVNHENVEIRNMYIFIAFMIIEQISRHILFSIANNIPTYHTADYLRVAIYRISGIKIGRKTRVAGPLILDLSLRENTFKCVEIGSDCYINYRCRISANKSRVSIGDNCLIGPNVSFETAGHSVSLDNGIREWISKPIIVGNNVWIGANALILAGVVVGDNAVIAAGAVVIEEVQAGTLVGGVPAKVLRGEHNYLKRQG